MGPLVQRGEEGTPVPGGDPEADGLVGRVDVVGPDAKHGKPDRRRLRDPRRVPEDVHG